MIGAEPTTSPLPRVCSTTELHGQLSFATYRPIKSYLERGTGLEPATLCLEGRYSSQLSYPRPYTNSCDCVFQVGGQGRIRTFVDVKPADLQSAPFSHSGTYPTNTYSQNLVSHHRKRISQRFSYRKMELVMGLEPATC